MDQTKLLENIQDELNFITFMGTKVFLYPFIGRSKIKIICYWFIYSLVILTFLQLILTLFIIGLNDWLEIINIAPNIGVCLMAAIKYKTIHENKNLYNEIYLHFKEDLWEFVRETLGENTLTVKEYTRYTKYLTRFIFVLCIVLIIVVDSFPWFIMSYENKILGKDLQYLYPIDAWYPFSKTQWYWVVYAWEGFMTAVVISIYAFANIVHLIYILFICMELKLLGNRLQGLISAADVLGIKARQNVPNIHEKIKSDLRRLIQRHELLYKISSGLDQVLGDIMLLSYTSSSVFICLTAFSFTVVEDLYKSLRYFSFCFSLLVEIFNQCILGQILGDHSVALAETIYSCDWIYADAVTKKTLLILMMRTQKPFRLSADRFLNMDLGTFSRICSISYRLFNLLRTVFHP